MSNANNKKLSANKALEILEIFRGFNPDMPMGEAVSFLLIANGETREGGGLTVTELGKLGDFSLAAASRYMRSLSTKNRQGELGHEVVTDHRDPLDDRRKVLRLSDKGREVVGRINGVLEKQ